VRPIPLLRFIPAISPKLWEPKHLKPVELVFDRIERKEAVTVFLTMPPRHAKTETIKHGIARLLLIDPSLRIGYASYAARLAEKKSREVRTLYQRGGGKLAADAFARADWRTGVGDGGLWAGGVEGSWTGEGFDVLFIDDPIQDRAHAESAVEREKLWDWFNDVAYTRLEPNGSIFVVHTRWHVDDLGGRLIRDGWESIHLPAIADDGRALWPERFNVAKLERIKRQIGAYAWASLYQGRPYARGGRLFGDAHFFDLLPARLQRVIGIDLAYSAKSQSDYSVAIVLGFDVETTEEMGAKAYILNVVRRQVEAPSFIRELNDLQGENFGAPMVWHYGGTEKGLVDVMKALGANLEAKPAIVDKFIRAQEAVAAWNDGRILIPRNATALGLETEDDLVEWSNDLVTELSAFTGKGDLHDDQVDALSTGYDAGKTPGWLAAMSAVERRGHVFKDPDEKNNGPQFCEKCNAFSMGPCRKQHAA
jgi:predicted phage terminase large subunit-like protein